MDAKRCKELQTGANRRKKMQNQIAPAQRLTISLSAIAYNYRLCQSQNQAHNTGQVAAVVKANAYGLGASTIAEHLHQQGCKHFFVATLTEAFNLRQHLSKSVVETPAEIFVLEGLLHEPSKYIASDLVPVLNTPEQCQRWHESGQSWCVHVDTGMQRLGLAPADLLSLASTLRPQIRLLLSHLACADEPAHSANEQQVQGVAALHQAIEQILGHTVPVSLGNTAGLLSVASGASLGRAGIGLFGANPFTSRANPFRPVACLEGQILQLREVPAGTPVGYGATYVTQMPAKLATVGLGYADGVPRLLSNCGRVWCAGQFAPIVGRVSMDLLSIDVTHIESLSAGDWVEVFGAHISVDEVAELAQTIGYEVLTGLGPRPQRSYQTDYLD